MKSKVSVGSVLGLAVLAGACSSPPMGNRIPSGPYQSELTILGTSDQKTQVEGVKGLVSCVIDGTDYESVGRAYDKLDFLRSVAQVHTSVLSDAQLTLARNKINTMLAGDAVKLKNEAELESLARAAESINGLERRIDVHRLAGVANMGTYIVTNHLNNTQFKVHFSSGSAATITSMKSSLEGATNFLTEREQQLYEDVVNHPTRVSVDPAYVGTSLPDAVKAYLNTAAGRRVQIRFGITYVAPAFDSKNNRARLTSRGLVGADNEEVSDKPTESFQNAPWTYLTTLVEKGIVTTEQAAELIAEARPNFRYFPRSRGQKVAVQWLEENTTPIGRDKFDTALAARGHVILGTNGRDVKGWTQIDPRLTPSYFEACRNVTMYGQARR